VCFLWTQWRWDRCSASNVFCGHSDDGTAVLRVVCFLWTQWWWDSCSATSVFSPVTAITPTLHTHFVHPPSTRYNLQQYRVSLNKTPLSFSLSVYLYLSVSISGMFTARRSDQRPPRDGPATRFGLRLKDGEEFTQYTTVGQAFNCLKVIWKSPNLERTANQPSTAIVSLFKAIYCLLGDQKTKIITYLLIQINIAANYNLIFKNAKIGKAIPLQAWTGPEGSRRLTL